MADLIHLVRHGEVENPGEVVYGALPGFPLSAHGRQEAAATAERLSACALVAVVSSPLDRAMETAGFIAAPHGLAVQTDERLVEWRLSDRWAATRWADLHLAFPGELEAYLNHPTHLPFSPESITEAAERVTAATRTAHERFPHGDVVIVAHQDPIQVGRLMLTGRPLTELHDDKPGHASVVTLRPGDSWTEESHWVPRIEAGASRRERRVGNGQSA